MGGGGGCYWIEKKEENKEIEERISTETDSGEIVKTYLSVVLPLTYLMIQIFQPVMNNRMN